VRGLYGQRGIEAIEEMVAINEKGVSHIKAGRSLII
jgi:hypothetical protein